MLHAARSRSISAMALAGAIACVAWAADPSPIARISRNAQSSTHRVRPVAPDSSRATATTTHLLVTFLDVGQGDGALLESGDGHAAMIDAGPPEAADHVRAVLSAHHVTTLDWLMFSHPHLDHIGSGAAVLGHVHVARVVDPAYPHAIATYDRLLARIQQLGLSFTAARTGATLSLGSAVRVALLLPHEPFLGGGRSDVNANSIVARVESGRVHVLFMGDAERPTEERLLAEQSTGALASDVLKVAHHGSRFASSAALLDAVHPRFAVISCGAGNGYGHPHAATLRLLAARGVTLHRTDLEGDVSLTTDGASIALEGTRATDAASLGTPGVARRGAREPN